MEQSAEEPSVEKPIPLRIQEVALDSLDGDQAFDEACLARLRALAGASRLSSVEEVIRTLRGEDASS